MKQIIVVRNDLKMSKGKIAAQSAHASVEASDRVSTSKKNDWKSGGMKKVVLKVDSLSKLKEIKKKADNLNIKNALITDAGRTELKPGTITVLGIGPDNDEKLDKITGKLKLLG
ncbi:aminoacyl-tRNA hydrolase [archaeon]|nr:aminoacyl-tRNA hydrolase [archaeon]|tara:strand:+ start:1552 stop:1893 length:342 start_codon:yes stop_codon:yes gene_type:complete